MTKKINILAVGQKMPDWVTKGTQHYLQRLSGHWQTSVSEIPAGKRDKQTNIARTLHFEGEQLWRHISSGDGVIALDRQGQSFSTEKFSDHLTHWMHDYSRLHFVIGGPEGLSSEHMARAQVCWSLSPLTLPHPLVRIMLAEQLYRAWSIQHNHPYHRGTCV